LYGGYDIKTTEIPDGTQPTALKIESFSVTPVYDSTADKPDYAEIVYHMNVSWDDFTDARLMLTVFHDGQYLEQVPLFALNQVLLDGKSGELNYVPLSGWESGEYAFRAELYLGENLVQDTELRKLTITPVSTAKIVSWNILGLIIGISLLVAIAIVIVVMYHRRDMLKGY
jgi:hypothetical protein